MQERGSFQLVMGQGPRPGHIFEFAHTSITIGRDPGNQVAVNDPQISRQHARITPQGGLFILEDLGSTNGTTVNGMRITGPHTLAHGDEIGLGENVTLVFYGRPGGYGDATHARFRPETIAPASETPSTRQYAPPPGQVYQPSSSFAPPVAGYAEEAPARYVDYPRDAYAEYDESYPEEQERNWLVMGLGCALVAIIVMLLVAFWLYFFAPASVVDPIADFLNGLGIDVCNIVSCG